MHEDTLEPFGCFGFCQDCAKVHSLPSSEAMAPAYALMEQLRSHGCIDFDSPPEISDARFSTQSLYTDLRGKMFGVLVCEDAQGNKQVLRAFSAKYNGEWCVPGWALPLVDAHKFDATVKSGDLVIHPLTEQINRLDRTSVERTLLVEKRKKVSHEVLRELYTHYEVHNFKQDKRSLADVFHSDKGMPTGTGDCCAPKLLNQAAKNGWKPLSMAEFFWGKGTLSGERMEGMFYSSCLDKCQPMLGYMLCGGTDDH
jgi:hypothetical protein